MDDTCVFDILSQPADDLARLITNMRDVLLTCKGTGIYEVRFFPHGMGEDGMVSDEEYDSGLRDPLGIPKLPIDRHRPALEVKLWVPTRADCKAIVAGSLKPARRMLLERHARIVARGERCEWNWLVSYVPPAPVGHINPTDLAQRLITSALAMGVQYELIANAQRRKK